jgi:hypothetical protein
MRAAKDGFQVGQTAKARLGPPCAVTPESGRGRQHPASSKIEKHCCYQNRGKCV